MLSIAHSRRRRRRLEWSVLALVLLALVAWLSTPESLGRVNHLVQDAGLRLLESLRQDPLTAALSVVVCSADVSYLDICREQLNVYGAEVVAKPFALDHLLETVRRMLPAEAEVAG